MMKLAFTFLPAKYPKTICHS